MSEPSQPSNPTLKIYTDDPLIKYTSTTVKADRSKQLIDAVLAEYQVKDVWWHYDLPREAWVRFKIEEEINGAKISVGVRVDCPTIWNRARTKRQPRTPEQINWDISMRAMYHFIYTHLNAAHAMQSGKAMAFLAYVVSGENTQVKDVILPRLEEMRKYAALEAQPQQKEEAQPNPKIVESADYKVEEDEKNEEQSPSA
jgi:hypothetical protein